MTVFWPKNSSLIAIWHQSLCSSMLSALSDCSVMPALLISSPHWVDNVIKLQSDLLIQLLPASPFFYFPFIGFSTRALKSLQQPCKATFILRSVPASSNYFATSYSFHVLFNSLRQLYCLFCVPCKRYFRGLTYDQSHGSVPEQLTVRHLYPKTQKDHHHRLCSSPSCQS